MLIEWLRDQKTWVRQIGEGEVEDDRPRFLLRGFHEHHFAPPRRLRAYRKNGRWKKVQALGRTERWSFRALQDVGDGLPLGPHRTHPPGQRPSLPLRRDPARRRSAVCAALLQMGHSELRERGCLCRAT